MGWELLMNRYTGRLKSVHLTGSKLDTQAKDALSALPVF